MASKVETMIRSAVTKGVFKVAALNRDAMAAPAKPHPYLSGIHTPMAGELTLESLKVTGTIPAGLNGRYIRIGPNPATPPNPGAYHWFTGDGMVHGVRLGGGKAHWYRNRWIRSTEVSALLGEAPAPGLRNGTRDNVNTNVLGHAGKTWGLVESGSYPVEIGAALETISHNPFEGTLKGSFSAHPHLDPESGEMHAICYDAMERTTIRHVVVGRDGKVRREEPISVSDGPSIHDCMITANYVLIFDLPVTFSMKRVLAGFAFPYAWNPEHKARIGLMPREGRDADIIWCDVPPCYVFHGCNAFETEDGKVIADVAVHDSMFADSTQGPDSKSVMLERWTIDPATRTVARAIVDRKPQEFPRFDERLAGKPYRYAYALPLPPTQDDFVSESHYIKHDLVAGTREIHEFGANRFPGEFMFVPKFAGAAEDEGWLMGYVVDMNTETTDLMILDAQDFAGAPQAVITIPHRIPPGFHGNWVADGG